MSQTKFSRRFKSEESCKRYLFKIKWQNGFTCKRCGNNKYWQGRTEFHLRCTSCGYDESITAHTIFHKLQMPLLKAFTIVFYVTVFKKGISCRNLSKIVDVSQKSVWFFKRKIQEAMASSLTEEESAKNVTRNCKVDGIVLTHSDPSLRGLQRLTVRIEQSKSSDHFKIFPANESSKLELDPCGLVGGRYVEEGKNILMWNFKHWLTGIHHHCSRKYFQGYLDEYCFRHSNRKNEKTIWHTLIYHMIRTKPYIFIRNAAKG